MAEDGSDPLFISERGRWMSVGTVQYLIKKYLCIPARKRVMYSWLPATLDEDRLGAITTLSQEEKDRVRQWLQDDLATMESNMAAVLINAAAERFRESRMEIPSMHCKPLLLTTVSASTHCSPAAKAAHSLKI